MAQNPNPVSWIVVLLVACLMVMMALFLVATARAHDAKRGWAYDYDCCSDKDCAEIPEHQTPRVEPSGFRLHDGQFVEKNSSNRRDSKDHRWHRCDGHSTVGPVSVPFIRCLYVPNGGV
jgi:hypothetical protein